MESLPLGTPRRTDVADNEFSGVSFGVLSFISDRTWVRRNRIQAGTGGVASLEDKNMVVSRDQLEGAVFGFLGTFEPRFEGPASGNFVWNNTFTGNVYGLLVDCATTGYTALNNEFIGSLEVDVLFDGTAPGGFCAGIGDSFGNTVIATRFPTSVLDFGSDNHVLGNMITQP